MNEDEMTPECEDFVILCYKLRRNLDIINSSDFSPRVWASVCTQKLIDICKDCPNPEKAFNQLIVGLNISFEDQTGIK